MVSQNDPTAEYVRSILDYDPETGVLTWLSKPGVTREERRWNTRYAGKEAGNIWTGYLGKQYRIIKINGRLYKAHRLAWLYMTGEWPTDQIDHIDSDGLNNRWPNLRPATRAQNNKNARVRNDNTSGFKGVSWHKGRWRARISTDGNLRHLGLFNTPEEAHAAYCKAAQHLHGEFARTA